MNIQIWLLIAGVGLLGAIAGHFFIDKPRLERELKAGASTWDMMSSRRVNRHIAVANIDGGDPASRLEAFVTEGISPRVWCRVVHGEQGEGFLLSDLRTAIDIAVKDLDLNLNGPKDNDAAQ